MIRTGNKRIFLLTTEHDRIIFPRATDMVRSVCSLVVSQFKSKEIHASPFSMGMSSTASRSVLETKEVAAKAVSSVLKNTETHFELDNFHKYNRTARLRFKHYQQCFVLCYRNTKISAG